jgi:hypothetical protein
VEFGWYAIEAVAVILVLLALILVGLAVRRRWVARDGGTFECSMRTTKRRAHSTSSDSSQSFESTPGTGWVLGVARYSGESLEWFRFFSLAWWPKYSFPRSEVRVVEHRQPSPSEAVALYAEQEVVCLSIGSGQNAERRDLAMAPDSLTGMLSWLEAAPPGINRY